MTKMKLTLTAAIVIIVGATVWHFTNGEKGERAQAAPNPVNVFTVTAAEGGGL